MLYNINKIHASDFFHLKKIFSYYDADSWYESRPQKAFHTLSSFEKNNGAFYFQFKLIYNPDLARKVRRIFGDLAYFNSNNKCWEIQAIPSIIDPEELLNKMRQFTSTTSNIFLAPSFYDLIDILKEQIRNKE